jgi:adenosine deaminase
MDSRSGSEFQQLPKAELHLHLGGSFPKEFLFSIATKLQQEQIKESLELISQRIDYNRAFHIFGLIAEVVNSEEKLENGVHHLCLSLKKDHVHYVEIRTGLKNLGKGPEEYLKAVLRGIEAHASEQFKANIVLSLQRSSSLEMTKETIDLALKYRDQGVVGLDISGNSTVGNIEKIMPELIRAKEEGIPFIVHMGETPSEIDQLHLLTQLEPKRIGHGVYLNNEAKEWILRHKTPLEICLTSSVLGKMIDEYKQHPGFDFFRLGHPIAFCTDDPLLFSTTMSQELVYAQIAGMSKEDIQQIVKKSFDYSLEAL